MQIFLIVVLLGNLGGGFRDFGALPSLAYLVGFTTVFSGLAYMVRWVFGVRVDTKWRRAGNSVATRKQF